MPQKFCYPTFRCCRILRLPLAVLILTLPVGAADVAPAPTPEPIPASTPPATDPSTTPPAEKSPAPATTPAPASPPAPDAPLPPPAVRPFETRPDQAAREGAVELSDGKKMRGHLALTEGKTIRLFDLQSKTYHDLTFDALKQIEVRVEFEKKEEEWSFKEGGNDEKIFTGNFYIDRRYQVRCTPLAGPAVTGYVLGTVFYLTTEENGKPVKRRFFLHKDERGENKQDAKDIVYVKKVEFDTPASTVPAPGSAPAAPAATQPEPSSTPSTPPGTSATPAPKDPAQP